VALTDDHNAGPTGAPTVTDPRAAARLGAALGLCLVLSSCRPDPGPPPPAPPVEEALNGGERLAWHQEVLPGTDLPTYEFALYVDGVRRYLAGATCDLTPAAAGHACSAPLPQLGRGRHLVVIAATCEFGGRRREGPPSVPLMLTIR
jgi:hypothetical protein